MKVKAQHVPKDCDYLTKGKKYQLFYGGDFHGYAIYDDQNSSRLITLGEKGCKHLNSHSWEVVSD